MCSDPQEFLMYLRKQIYMHFLRVLLFQGDSGGPLVTTTQPPVLVGIVSYGPCGPPEVYAKVSAMWHWLAFFCSVPKIPFEIIKPDELP